MLYYVLCMCKQAFRAKIPANLTYECIKRQILVLCIYDVTCTCRGDLYKHEI